jgi:hypothetical protein
MIVAVVFGAHGPKGAVLFLAFWIWAAVPVLPRLGGGVIGGLGWVLLIVAGLVLAATVADELHGVVLGILVFPGRALGGAAGTMLGLANGAYEVARVAGAALLPGMLTAAMLLYFARLDRRTARAAAAQSAAAPDPSAAPDSARD